MCVVLAAFEEIDELSLEDLQKRSELPPEVMDYFLLAHRATADKQEVDALWAHLKTRALHNFTGESLSIRSRLQSSDVLGRRTRVVYSTA